MVAPPPIVPKNPKDRPKDATGVVEGSERPIDYNSDFAFRGSTGTSTGSGTQGSSASGSLGQSSVKVITQREADIAVQAGVPVSIDKQPTKVSVVREALTKPSDKPLYVSIAGTPEGEYILDVKKPTVSNIYPRKSVNENVREFQERKNEVVIPKKTYWDYVKVDFAKRATESSLITGISLAAGPEVAAGVGAVAFGSSLYSGYKAYKEGQLVPFLGSATPSLVGGFVAGGIVNAKTSGLVQGYYEALPLPSRVKGRVSREFLYSRRLGQIQKEFGKNSLEASQFKTEYEVSFGKPAVRYFNPMSNDFLIGSNIKLSRGKLVSEFSAGNVGSAKGLKSESIAFVNKKLIESQSKIIGSGTLGIKGRPIGDVDAQTGGIKVAKEIYGGLKQRREKVGYDYRGYTSKFGEKASITIKGKEFINIGSSPSYYYGQIKPNLNLFEFTRIGAFVKSPKGFILASARDQLRVKFEKGYFLPGATERLRAVQRARATGNIKYLEDAPGRAKDIFDVKEVVGRMKTKNYGSLKQSQRLFRTPKITKGELNGKTKTTEIRARTGEELELQYRGRYATGRTYPYPYTQKVGYYKGATYKSSPYYSSNYKTNYPQPKQDYYPVEKYKPKPVPSDIIIPDKKYYSESRPSYYPVTPEQTYDTPYFGKVPPVNVTKRKRFKMKDFDKKNLVEDIIVKTPKMKVFYVPDLTSLTFNIKGKPSKYGVKTGLALRPLTR